MKCSHWFF